MSETTDTSTITLPYTAAEVMTAEQAIEAYEALHPEGYTALELGRYLYALQEEGQLKERLYAAPQRVWNEHLRIRTIDWLRAPIHRTRALGPALHRPHRGGGGGPAPPLRVERPPTGGRRSGEGAPGGGAQRVGHHDRGARRDRAPRPDRADTRGGPTGFGAALHGPSASGICRGHR